MPLHLVPCQSQTALDSPLSLVVDVSVGRMQAFGCLALIIPYASTRRWQLLVVAKASRLAAEAPSEAFQFPALFGESLESAMSCDNRFLSLSFAGIS